MKNFRTLYSSLSDFHALGSMSWRHAVGPHQVRKSGKRLVCPVCIALAGLIIFGGCKGQKEVKRIQKPVTEVKTVQLKKGTIRKTISLIGDINAEDEAVVYPQITGKVIKKFVKEGDFVKKQAQLLTVDRDKIGLKFEEAPVRSPINGIVGKIYVDKGANVSPTTPVAVVVSMDMVKVKVHITEEDLPKLNMDQKAEIRVDAYPGIVFVGQIRVISPVVDPISRKAEVKIFVPNKDHKLKSGMFARVEIIIKKRKNTLIVPQKAITEINGRQTVFVVDGSSAKAKAVKIGFRNKQNIEILDGLNEGDAVIIEGNYGLEDGAKIKCH